MKRWGYCLSALLLLTTYAPGMSRVAQSEGFPTTGRIQGDCIELFTRIFEDEGFLEQLVDPIIMTAEELSERQSLYFRLHECLHGELSAVAEELRIIDILTEYFLVIVGGMETPQGKSQLFLVDLTTSANPAIRKVRDEAGVKPPAGYVYVRHYSSREAMPDLVRRAFENEDVAGVTMLTRYIAILAEEEGSSLDLELQSQRLPKTISHELVHAYVNSVLGFERSANIPIWYQEGLAIYFSGSGVSSYVYLSPEIKIKSISPEDYEQYELNFKYLEAELGHERLLELVKQSIEKSDPSALYKDLGITSDNMLPTSARAWQKDQESTVRKWGLAIVSLLILGIIGMISIGRMGEQDQPGRIRN